MSNTKKRAAFFAKLFPISIVYTYFHFMNSYFGWNWRPESGIEVACDGVLMVLVVLAIINWKVQSDG